MSFCDLHSHILPGIDDGSPDIATSLAMISGLIELGFTTISATPHQKTGQYLPSLDSIRRAHDLVLGEVSKRNWQVRIPLAAENMWDETLYTRIQKDEIPSYDGANVFLMEFIPNQLPVGVFERIFELRCKKKMLPVLAHPERYSPLWKAPDLLERLAADCAMVVDLGALAGNHGRNQAKAARKMVLNGMAHAAASDAHDVSDIKSATAGIAWIRKKLGDAGVTRLLTTNPAQILQGVHPG